MAATRNDLIDALAGHVGTAPLTDREVDACLALAGAAAHGTGDRTTAPLATFLAGVAAARSDDRTATLDDIRSLTLVVAPADEAAR